MREDSKLQNASFKSCNLKLSRLGVLTFFELLANKCWRGQYSGHISAFSGVRRKFSWGGFIQYHVVVICIWCVLFV